MKFKLNKEEYARLSFREQTEYHDRRADRFHRLLLVAVSISTGSAILLLILSLIN